MGKKIKFEDKIDVIESELNKQRYRWQLKARTDLDYDDVKQIIRIHIYNKWYQWKQDKPLEPWLYAIITHQIKNLLRNYYKSFSRPCLECPANQGGDLCAIYGKQALPCPLYKKWLKSKKNACDVKLPLPFETHQSELESYASSSFMDYEQKEKEFHNLIRPRLNKIELKIYQMIYVEGYSEHEVAKHMGYKKTEEKRKQPRYKQLENHKKNLLKIAKDLLYENGI